MKLVWLAAAAVWAASMQTPATAAPPEVAAMDYSKARGLVAAAYTGGGVVVWDFATGRVTNVFNSGGQTTTLNRPLVHFSPDGRRIAYTAEGDAGLVAFDFETGASTVLVPRRLLYKGITSFTWSRQNDAVLVAIGREIHLVHGDGHLQWQRRLETRALITDVVWHPSEQYYTVATDDAIVSSYDLISGQVMGTAALGTPAHSVAVKVEWNGDGSAIAATLQGSLAYLDPDTLKPRKSIACNCAGFDWSPNRKEIAAAAPPNILMVSDAGLHSREVHTTPEATGALLWIDENHLLAAAPESQVVLREVRSSKVVRTFVPGADKKP